MFESVEDVQKRLGAQSYICDKNIATVVFLATKLEKPVLVEGPAGVGKTELAKVVAAATGHNDIEGIIGHRGINAKNQDGADIIPIRRLIVVGRQRHRLHNQPGS